MFESKLMDNPPLELLNNRSHPVARTMLEDWLTENNAGTIRACLDFRSDAAADADADDDADADAAAADAAADADAADADAADDDADAADADADDARDLIAWYKGAQQMREGFVLMVSPGAWRILCRIGWLRRVEGDEWELVNCRSVIRTGGYDSDGLQKLAQCRGEIKNHALGLISKIAEPIHRLQMIRPLPIPREDWESWEVHCPKPKDWEEK